MKKEVSFKHLHEIGIKTGSTLKKLQELCRQHNLPMEVIEQKIVEGWEENRKGLLQALWDRGVIDAYGVIQKEKSLKHLMSINCTDFKEDESLLQLMGRHMGVMVDCTP
jgi:hypothetical protein